MAAEITCCDCGAEMPCGPGGVYRRARALGWARRYRRRGMSDFACPDCRHDRRPRSTEPVGR